MVDTKKLRESELPTEPSEFEALVRKHCSDAREAFQLRCDTICDLPLKVNHASTKLLLIFQCYLTIKIYANTAKCLPPLQN